MLRATSGLFCALLAGVSFAAPEPRADYPLHPIRPRSDVEGARLTEIEQDGSGRVEQGEHAPRAAFGDDVEIGHAAAEQRVALAEVVVNVEARHHRREVSARLVHA